MSATFVASVNGGARFSITAGNFEDAAEYAVADVIGPAANVSEIVEHTVEIWRDAEPARVKTFKVSVLRIWHAEEIDDNG